MWTYRSPSCGFRHPLSDLLWVGLWLSKVPSKQKCKYRGVCASTGLIHLLQLGVLHRLQCVYMLQCGPLWGMQRDNLLYHGSLHGQGNPWSNVWNTSSPFFFSQLTVCRAVSHTFPLTTGQHFFFKPAKKFPWIFSTHRCSQLSRWLCLWRLESLEEEAPLPPSCVPEPFPWAHLAPGAEHCGVDAREELLSPHAARVHVHEGAAGEDHAVFPPPLPRWAEKKIGAQLLQAPADKHLQENLLHRQEVWVVAGLLRCLLDHWVGRSWHCQQYNVAK